MIRIKALKIKFLCEPKPNLFQAIQDELLKTWIDTMDLRDLDINRVLYKLS